MVAADDGAPGAALTEALARALADQLGEVRVGRVWSLGGGASREMLAFDARTAAGTVPLVLACPASGPGRQVDLGLEWGLLGAAHAAGVPAPRPYARLDAGAHGDAGLIVERLEGEALPPRLLREERFATARGRLVGEVAGAAARLHALPPAAAGLAVDGRSAAERALDEVEAMIDAVGEPHPALEAGLRRLRLEPPAVERGPVIVHGDLRLGNVLVGEEGLVALLDWELGHAGDPAEDLGWMCARSWRFGRDDHPALGLGSRDELLRAYREAGGEPIGRAELHWWEALASARWAGLCLVQTARYLVDPEGTSLELGAVGRRAAEAEWDLLALLG
jgi:aminoglycoside phosphotransferase (APT) family kinase protein